MKVYIMTGIPGSGKTTAAKEICAKENLVHLSADIVREQKYGDASIQGDGRVVFAILNRQILSNLKKGKDICIDNMSLKVTDRNAIKRLISKEGIEDVEYISVYLDTPLLECIENDTKRDRHVGEEIIRQKSEKLMIPTKEEGFAKVIRAKRNNSSFDFIEE